MGLQKYRADKSEVQQDGARLWFCDWMGGPTLSKIENCRLENLTELYALGLDFLA